jgi:hypothetical protein
MIPTNPKKSHRKARTASVQWDDLRLYLIDLHATKSLRQISHEIYFDQVTFGVIGRCIKGEEPRDPHIRAILRLPILAPAPVCPTCGEIHIKARCPHRKQPPAWVTRGADFLEMKLREKEGLQP